MIGSIVQQAEEAGYRSTIVTGDRCSAVDLPTDQGLADQAQHHPDSPFDRRSFAKEYELNPAQVIDLKGLMGIPLTTFRASQGRRENSPEIVADVSDCGRAAGKAGRGAAEESAG